MEQKKIFNISDFQKHSVMPEEEKELIMISLKQQATNAGIDISKSHFSEEHILRLFTMESDSLTFYLNAHIELTELAIQVEGGGYLTKEVCTEQSLFKNTVSFIEKFIKNYNQHKEIMNRKRKEPEQSSNRYSFNSNKRTKDNHNNENSSQNNLSVEEKNKILNDLKEEMGEDIFNDVLLVYNAFKYKHETLFNILQNDLETALEELNEQLLSDIEVTMYELKEENELKVNTQELHKASPILANVAKGYDILTSYVEKYIAEHHPSPLTPPSQ